MTTGLKFLRYTRETKAYGGGAPMRQTKLTGSAVSNGRISLT
jgi:hypothetical protein